MSLYKEQLEAWLKTIDVKAKRVLDIGGSAYPVKGRTKSWDVDEYHIADNENEKDWHDRWRKPDIRVDLNDKSLCGSARVASNIRCYYDLVFCLEVFEYVFAPKGALQKIEKVMRDGSGMYISFPSIYPVHNPKESDSLRYTKYGIKKLFSQTLLSIEEIVPRKATKGRKALQKFYSLEGMRAVKNDDCIYDIGYMIKAIKK
jgi:SAM-dependent methyltransferase